MTELSGKINLVQLDPRVVFLAKQVERQATVTLAKTSLSRRWLDRVAVVVTIAGYGVITIHPAESENEMQIQYLEIVTPNVDVVCETYEKLHGVSFSAPEAGLGNARTAAMASGGMIGVRAPMHDAEEPVVRPYLLVDDIDAAVAEAGSEIAHPPMEIPGHGKFAIYIQGGIHHGLWQV